MSHSATRLRVEGEAMMTAHSTQHTAHSSSRLTTWGYAVLAAGAMSIPAVAQGPTMDVQTVFSTHDKTTTPGSESFVLPEVWADVKSPGDGRVYAVGTIEVNTTDPINLPEYSGRPITQQDIPALPPPFDGGFTVSNQGQRQIVVLQCSNDDGTIQWQKLWYGSSSPTSLSPWARRATNARGISVWPAATEAETRVAICGETYDVMLSKNQYDVDQTTLVGWNRIQANTLVNTQNSQWGLPNGYIAVFDGGGALLWSYQFFYRDHDGHCAITDVSIRVQEVDAQLRDIVTYCGVSSFGVPTLDPLDPLAPRNWFDAPTTNVPGYIPAHGAQDNRNNLGFQWDGIVGRISNLHTSPSNLATTQEFHAIVGGREQDGLWGIAEATPDRFIVVGGTAAVLDLAAPNHGAPDVTFPLTQPVSTPANFNLNASSSYCIGTATVFANDPTSGVFQIAQSSRVGEPWTGSQQIATHLRDVMVQFDADPPPMPLDRLVMVGATQDAGVFTRFTFGTPASSVVFGGGTDGFIATAFSVPTQTDLLFAGAGFQGTGGNWCGVGGFAEFRDHAAVFGASGDDLQVASYFVDTPVGEALIQERIDVVPTTAVEIPAAMGRQHATKPPSTNPSSLEYQDFGLGSPAGGGVCMDPRTRVNICGSTTGPDYPTIGAPIARSYGVDTEAVRTVLDLLPVGVCRTDATGFDGTGLPLAIQPGADGGTTPACMRLPFGPQPGMASPSYIPRMWIDYEGAPPAQNGTAAITVDRPPVGSIIVGSFLCYGLPSVPWQNLYPNPAPIHDIEMWVDPLHWSFTSVLQFPMGLDQSWRFNLAPLPPIAGSRFTVQVVAMLGAPIAPSAACPIGSPNFDYAASPGLVFFY